MRARRFHGSKQRLGLRQDPNVTGFMTYVASGLQFMPDGFVVAF
jgi:hypothetical protein